MATTITLTGFPNVLNVSVFQTSGTRPGRIVVDTTVVAGASATWPDVTTLTIVNGANTFTWADIRVVRAPRSRRGYMRTVFEDSRWKLRDATIGADYNTRDGLGNLLIGNDKTIAQLATILSDASGVTIGVGATVPSFKPTMKWRGKTAQECLQWLLDNAVCRLVYNPIASTYKIWAAGSGSLPSATRRLFKAGPDRDIESIEAYSSPIIHEARLPATAVVDNAAGELEDLDNYDGDGYFDDFEDHAGDDTVRSRLIATSFRMWKLDAPEDKELLPHRALPISPEGYASAKAVRNTLQTQMRQHPIFTLNSDDPSTISGGIVFVSDDPILDSYGASLKTTADILVGYYELADNARVRQSESRTIGLGSSVRKFYFDWIRPIDSSEPDIGTQAWGDLLSDVADAIETKYSQPAATLILPGLPLFTESGHVGAAQYMFSTHPRNSILTRLALDFDPVDRIF